MDPSARAILLGALFVATHIGLTTQTVRSRLVARLGEWGFRWLFFAVAATSFTALTAYYADHRFEGPAGPALGTSPLFRAPLIAAVVAGVLLMVASFARYSGSPYDVERPNAARPPRGLERVTRHPFFVGMGLFGIAHALLATHLVGSVLMLALAILALGGAMHQDTKLARLRGAPFERYVAETSLVPFAAILAGRQPFAWRELPWVAIALGLGLALLLRAAHDGIFAYHGAWVIGGTVGGALSFTISGWLRGRRHRPDATRAPYPSGTS